MARNKSTKSKRTPSDRPRAPSDRPRAPSDRPRTPSDRPRASRASKRPPAAQPTAQPSSWKSLVGVVAGTLGLVVFGVYVFAEHAKEIERETPAIDQQTLTVVPDRLVARVHARHPHKPDAFTQGLVWDRGRMFESTGLEGQSSLREVTLDSGDVSRVMETPADIFAEGLAVVGDELVQLTWQDHVAYVYDRDTFTKRTEHRYEGEGWGLCNNGTHLVMSDGTDVLRFRDPRTFDVVRSVSVTRLGRPLRLLNELECVGDDVYANVWQTNDIVRIDAQSGAVEAIIDASALTREVSRAHVDVLNGIAYVPERERFLVTGKLWPTMFEVTFERERAGP